MAETKQVFSLTTLRYDEPIAYKSSQAGEHSKPQQPYSDHTTDYTSSVVDSNPFGESVLGTNLVPTIPRRPLAITNDGSLPSITEAHQPPNPNGKLPTRIPRHLVQDPITTGPPNSFYTSSVANLIQVQIPEEPVEEGVMSSQASMRTTLPPYSPGGFRDNEDAPTLP